MYRQLILFVLTKDLSEPFSLKRNAMQPESCNFEYLFPYSYLIALAQCYVILQHSNFQNSVHLYIS